MAPAFPEESNLSHDSFRAPQCALQAGACGGGRDAGGTATSLYFQQPRRAQPAHQTPAWNWTTTPYSTSGTFSRCLPSRMEGGLLHKAGRQAARLLGQNTSSGPRLQPVPNVYQCIYQADVSDSLANCQPQGMLKQGEHVAGGLKSGLQMHCTRGLSPARLRMPSSDSHNHEASGDSRDAHGLSNESATSDASFKCVHRAASMSRR